MNPSEAFEIAVETLNCGVGVNVMTLESLMGGSSCWSHIDKTIHSQKSGAIMFRDDENEDWIDLVGFSRDTGEWVIVNRETPGVSTSIEEIDLIGLINTHSDEEMSITW